MAYGRIAAIQNGTTNFTMNNKTAILTMDNVVMICGDIENVTVGANGVIYTLPSSSMFPSSDIVLVIMGLSGTTYSQRRIRIKPNGTIVTDSGVSNMTFYTNGIMFHVNSKYYNDTIGNNNQNTMTRPMDAS